MAVVPPRAVVFDLDGIITDTAEFHYLGWQRLADEIGVPFDREANESLRGLSRRESLLELLGDHEVDEEQLEEMMERKNRYYVDSLDELGPEDTLPGAIELIDDAEARGLALAIGSSSKNAQLVLDRLQLTDRFPVVSDGHSVERAKPAPDLFLHAARELGVEPQAAIVIEDAGSGVDAALAGDMPVIGVGPKERVGHATYHFETVAAIDLDVVDGIPPRRGG
jgi:beta-phosphoglucomutase